MEEYIEKIKWHGKPKIAIYQNNVIIGYTISFQEAEKICDQNPIYQWDFKKTLPKDVQLMIANSK